MADHLSVEFADPDIGAIITRFGKLEDALKKKAVTSGLRESAKKVKTAMRRNAPRDTGALRKSIGHRQLSRTAKSRLGIPFNHAAILVGPINRVPDPGYQRAPGKKIHQGFKALWMEFGVKPHPIPKQTHAYKFYVFGRFNKIKQSELRRERKVLKFNGRYAMRVYHRGVRGKEFMGPAYRQTQSSVPDDFYVGMEAYLNKHA